MIDARRLFEDHDIRSLSLTRDANIADGEASKVRIRFASREGAADAGYEVTFKLLTGGSGSHRYLRGIGPPPDCAPELTEDGRALAAEELAALREELLEAIRDRVAKIHKEQSILNTQPVGKCFRLSSGTRFEVLSDDGEGRLRIRILGKDGAGEVSLAANDLLDGLHSGLIKKD